MQIHRSVLVVGMLSAGLFACGDDDDDDVVVEQVADPNADFTSYQTFAFAPLADGGTALANITDDVAANLTDVNDAIRTELEDQGLTEVNPDESPDLYAFSLASSEQQTALFWECIPGYWYGYWAGAWDPCAYLSPQYDTFTLGTLAIGLSDPNLGKVVFAGLAQGVLNESDPEDEIDDAVEEIFDAYPKDQTGSGQ